MRQNGCINISTRGTAVHDRIHGSLKNILLSDEGRQEAHCLHIIHMSHTVYIYIYIRHKGSAYEVSYYRVLQRSAYHVIPRFSSRASKQNRSRCVSLHSHVRKGYSRCDARSGAHQHDCSEKKNIRSQPTSQPAEEKKRQQRRR